MFRNQDIASGQLGSERIILICPANQSLAHGPRPVWVTLPVFWYQRTSYSLTWELWPDNASTESRIFLLLLFIICFGWWCLFDCIQNFLLPTKIPRVFFLREVDGCPAAASVFVHEFGLKFCNWSINLPNCPTSIQIIIIRPNENACDCLMHDSIFIGGLLVAAR